MADGGRANRGKVAPPPGAPASIGKGISVPWADVAERVRSDVTALRDPGVKELAGRRFRDLFTGAAAADPEAVKAASRRIGVPWTDFAVRVPGDGRSDRVRIAERFLRDGAATAATELAPAPSPAPTRTALVFCPGLINSMLPMRAFATAFREVRDRHGWRVIAADAHPMRSCEANGEDLLAAIERGEGLDADTKPIRSEDAEPPDEVILLCYSKGSPDAMELLVRRPDLAAKVRGVFFWAGAIGGSHLADDIYEQVKDMKLDVTALPDILKLIAKTMMPVVGLGGMTERLDEYDVKGAIRDLTTWRRTEFLERHSGDLERLGIPFFNLTGATRPSEVPYFQVQGARQLTKHDPDNDMQVTQAQAKLPIPMATDLATFRAHHWDLSYDRFPAHTRMGSANLLHPFPRTAAIEAIFRFGWELGLVR